MTKNTRTIPTLPDGWRIYYLREGKDGRFAIRIKREASPSRQCMGHGMSLREAADAAIRCAKKLEIAIVLNDRKVSDAEADAMHRAYLAETGRAA